MYIISSQDNHFLKTCTAVLKGRVTIRTNDLTALTPVQKKDSTLIIADYRKDYANIIDEISCPVIALTGVPDYNEAVMLLRKGVRGYGNRLMRPDNLTKVLEAVLSGQIWLPPAMLTRLLANIPVSTSAKHDFINILSSREMDIARLVADGFSNKEIAEHLDITVRTVKSHLTSIFTKTGLRDRIALALAMQS